MSIVKRLLQKLETTLPVVVLQGLMRFRWILLLGLLVWVNAIAVAYFSHKNRQQTALLEKLKYQQYQLEIFKPINL